MSIEMPPHPWRDPVPWHYRMGPIGGRPWRREQDSNRKSRDQSCYAKDFNARRGSPSLLKSRNLEAMPSALLAGGVSKQKPRVAVVLG